MSGRRRRRQDQGNGNRNRSSNDRTDAPRRSRPPAPPPAPRALVTIMKNNRSVLAYFNSLQENLEYDVQKWKDRARYYQSLYEKEQEENARLKALRVAAAAAAATTQQDNGYGATADSLGAKQTQKAPGAGDSVDKFSQNDTDKTTRMDEKLEDVEIGKERAKTKGPPMINADEEGANIGDSDFDILSSDDEKSTEMKADRSLEKLSYQHYNGKPRKSIANDEKAKDEIDQSMLDLFSSDNDEDTDDSDARGKSVKKQKTSSMPEDGSGYKASRSYDEKSGTINDTEAQSAPPFWQKHKVHIMEELIDAYQCLKYIGVELVTRNTINNDEKRDEQGTPTVELDRVDGNGAPKESSEEHNKHAAESDEEQEEFFSFLPGQQETQAVKRQIAAENTTNEGIQGDGLEGATDLFERRSNEDVVADILRALGDLSRIQIHYKGLPEKYSPFRISPLWIPAGDFLQPEYTDAETADQPDHPIRLAKICIFRALSVMDSVCDSENLSLACCSPSSEDAWNGLFVGLHPGISSEPDLLPAIKVGMRDRKDLVDQLIDSLFAEISESWAVSDRSMRIQNDVLLYDATEKIEATVLLESDKAEKKIEGNERAGEVVACTDLHKAAGTKSQPRLSSLIERRLLAQITVHLCLLRKDPQKAFQLVHNYLSSTTPSLELEDYPKLQPVLSLVVLEGMLRVDKDLLPLRGWMESTKVALDDSADSEAPVSWFSHCLSQVHARLHQRELNDLVRQSIGLAIQTTACIWRQRQQSPDDRISDIARVELASYRRLLVLESSWLSDEYCIDDSEGLQDLAYNATLFDRCRDAAGNLIDEFRRGFLSKERLGERSYPREIDSLDLFTVSVTSALHLASVLLGDDDVVMELFSSSTSMINDDSLDTSTKQSTEAVTQAVVYACCMTVRQIELRKLDIYRQRVGCFVNPDMSDKFARAECLSGLLQLLRAADLSRAWDLAATTLDCCRLLSDGEAANEVIALLVQLDGSSQEAKVSDPILNRVFEAIEKAAKLPVVRVINLKRRSDRMDSMMSHVLQSSVLVLKALATMDDSNENNGDIHSFCYYGKHAVDGVLTKGDKIAGQIIQSTGATQNPRRLLEAYVAAEWRPHDLKPFDINANSDEAALLRISDSERACALSHISAWKGVLRSLTVGPAKTKGNLFEDGESVKRLFRHSGFARGQALHPENSSMPPSAVCVVLEDDAILVERFVERLDRLLGELPRDFHFCSLGYSRPRTAPLVKFSSQLGIPTCIWYLTGYIISMEGAKHLISSLPVRGPVDSWIGLKMCANWDNSFGEMVGVGVNSKPFEEAPARKELAQILKFRAFAALVPLCNQRVGTNLSTAGVSERNWRQRDTDIIYSGSENYRNK